VLTLKRSLVECLPTLDLNAFPSMIVCAAEQITFCDQAEKALRDNSMAALQRDLARKLEEYTGHGQDTDPVVNLKLKAVILDIIHDLDVVDQMQKNNVKHRTDWYWHKQLRYYMEDQCCMVRMCDALNAYTYEYQGNDAKLVHTPLTDKCYLTLTQGLHLGYGGNPYGPAGTGKTESVKALGQALARQVLVFNCDEGIDYKSMGRIFTGLVKCGAWGCFDEFNRLEAEVLSAVSQQIQTIQAALKEKRTQVNLLGTIINVNPNSGIFVTLNPAGKGYGGRSELPDNLKQLFRSVAMAAPDNALIGEVILYAEGYKHAKIVGTKVVELFTLSKQLLSKQQAGKPIELKDEMELVIKAVRLNTLAKLTFQDTHRFEALIKDIFPGTEVKDAVYADLEAAIRASLVDLKLDPLDSQFQITAAIRASLVDLKLDPLDSQVKKVVQLNENLNQRMGCVIVGPSGCGKSALLRILRSALARMGQKVLVHTMNPKAMPRQQLLGHMDMDTREWFDGVLTASARLVVKEPPDVRSWIVCDGDIDPEWVESLNSVLDDNRLLTMPSGERIRFGPNVNFIFETNDLKSASPATVSRMGMIFLSDEDMDPGCLVHP
ncbi:hydrolytic ATP binding site of dynein motor region D1-domain-containing protein, partial [Baffinella frigidus]